MTLRTILMTVAVGASAHAAQAAIVQIDVTGAVGFNVIGGNQANVPDGAPVLMSFRVDSDVFTDSPNFPVRGYPLDLASFSLLVGGNPITIDNPQPAGTAYFVLRNNDPAVDGFVLSRNIDLPVPVSVHVPGLAPAHDLDFMRTFNDAAPLTSLDILDAVGSYDQTNLSVYNWTVGRFGNPGAEYVYQTITISVVPAPSAGAALAGVLLLLRKPSRPRGT